MQPIKKRTRALNSMIAVLALGLIVAILCFPKMAFAEGKIELTPELAERIAQDFRISVSEEQEVSVTEPIRIFDDSYQAIGYIIEYQSTDGEPEGYVILDNSDATLISEWSFEKGTRSPISSSFDEISAYSFDDASPLVIKSAPFTYVASLPEQAIALNESGEDVSSEFGDFASYNSTPDSPNWYAIFIDGFSSDYTMNTFRNAIDEFICFSESEAESRTGKYGCAVTAMLNCAPHYVSSFDWNNWGTDYNSLWNLSNTIIDHSSGGISYGSTPNNKIGPAFASYCASKGTTVRYSNSMNPFWDFFKTAVDRGDLSIFCAGINIDGSRSGHAMAVEGYSILRPSSGAGENIYTLFVADGWDQGRFVNFYYTKYTDTYGVAFSG